MNKICLSKYFFSMKAKNGFLEKNFRGCGRSKLLLSPFDEFGFFFAVYILIERKFLRNVSQSLIKFLQNCCVA